ncbi:hypothetical protein BRC64_09650 [Halobacteriales archaeon QH_10_67_22]|nr:MAG: hypothetical protein BRC64_09650 [Halobacteriales archaeon QH_10_67_22]
MRYGRTTFVAVSLGWSGVSLLFLVSVGVFTYELLFVCSLLGLLVARELTFSVYVDPSWQRYAHWLTVLGLAAFVGTLLGNFLRVFPVL